MPGTCQELLKWKFAEMNSVDFRYRMQRPEGQQLELLETRQNAPDKRRRGYHALPGACVGHKACWCWCVACVLVVPSCTSCVASSHCFSPLYCFCLQLQPASAADARVVFPESEDPAMYDMRIIECSYDAENQVWGRPGQQAFPTICAALHAQS